jgi:hypothetical protein
VGKKETAALAMRRPGKRGTLTMAVKISDVSRETGGYGERDEMGVN